MSFTYQKFKWTRDKYRKAHQLARLFSRWSRLFSRLDCQQLPSEPPDLLRRYFELWERHPQHDDPLFVPLKCRYDRSGIPF